jgi:hypothetical protein
MNLRCLHSFPCARFVPALAGLLMTTACNAPDREPLAPPATVDADDFHEKSFAWDDAATAPALSKISARETRFADAEAFLAAVQALTSRLEDRSFTDSLWKPLDHACDELDLALWNTYGTIRVGDSTVFNESVLRDRCSPIEGGAEESVASDEAAGVRAADTGSVLEKSALNWKWWTENETEHRVYPYKMIGRSWSNFNLIVYRSTGGETQFKKHREKYWQKAWWDTDASRIGVRVYLLNCGINKYHGVRTCYHAGTRTASGRNDDYVSARDAGYALAFTLTERVKPGLEVNNVRVNDAAVSMHSVDHAGIAFRAQSSAGFNPSTPIEGFFYPPEYVTW